MAKGAEKALIAGATVLLPKEQEYLEQYPTLYRNMVRPTIRETIDIVKSTCTFVEYQRKGKKWVKRTAVQVLTLMGKKFTNFEACINPGGMYSVSKSRLGADK